MNLNNIIGLLTLKAEIERRLAGIETGTIETATTKINTLYPRNIKPNPYTPIKIYPNAGASINFRNYADTIDILQIGVLQDGIGIIFSALAYLKLAGITVQPSGPTANRPNLFGYNDKIGACFFDTTIGKPIWLKTYRITESTNLSSITAATSNGDVTLTLNGIAYNIPVLAGDSGTTVASKITTYIALNAPTLYTPGGGGNSCVITAKIGGSQTDATFSGGTTGVTATVTVTTQGADDVWVDGAGTVV